MYSLYVCNTQVWELGRSDCQKTNNISLGRGLLKYSDMRSVDSVGMAQQMSVCRTPWVRPACLSSSGRFFASATYLGSGLTNNKGLPTPVFILIVKKRTGVLAFVYENATVSGAQQCV